MIAVVTVVAVRAVVPETAYAENSLVINDLTQQDPGSTIEIPVYITNDVELRLLVVPLAFRRQAESLAYVTAAKASFRDRLPTSGPDAPLSEIQVVNRYDAEDGSCKEDQVGGFGTITYVGDTTSHPVNNDPFAFLFARVRVVGPNLPPGTDAAGSLVFTVTLNEEPGCFYIDTTCVNPINHLDFQANDNTHIVPLFRSGQICIETGCACPHQGDFEADGYLSALDLGTMIDILFEGEPDIQDVRCPSPRADFDCDGFSSALDMGQLIDHLFASGDGPCDPCLTPPPR